MTTETELKSWRYGTTQAERLCAAILQLQQFDEIDPQAPLGGPDGTKDILCTKNGIRYVAAAYFPTTEKSFPDLKKKFSGDLKGVKKHERDGFLFFTNQHLTISERDTLLADAAKCTRDCQIFHLERIRAVLDQPAGYGVRVEFLRISLSPEEQFAYFTHSRDGMERLMEHQSRMLGTVNSKLDRLIQSQEFVAQTVALNFAKDGFEISPPPSRPDLFLGGTYRQYEGSGTKDISPQYLLMFHRAICFDLPSNSVGHLRTRDVFLAQAGKAPEQAVKKPPKSDEVPALLDVLCKNWRENFEGLLQSKPNEKLRSIAAFHAQFLRIHPFLDGNGRVARYVLMQQCLDLFGVADMGVLDKGAEYYAALRSADHDDIKFLTKLIAPVVGVSD